VYKNHRMRAPLLAVIIGLLLATAGYGQEMEKGQVEAAGLAGIVAGIGTHGTIGGSIGAVVRDRIFAYGELSYIPGGGGGFQVPGFSAESSAKAINFNAGAHYLFSRNNSIVPYAGAGIGILRSTFSTSTTVGGVTTSGDFSNTDFYFNFGGGFRYSFNDRWGVRPELMVFAGSEVFVRIGAGVYYHFPR